MRTTWFGIEKPFPWLGFAIIAAEIVGATLAVLATITGALFIVHCFVPIDLNDI